MRFGQLAVVVIALVSSTALTATLVAQESDVVQHRQMKMKAMGKDTGRIKKALSDGDLSQVGAPAMEIGKTADEIPSLFPKDADNTGSAALPTVWSDRAGFEKAAAHMGELADQLAETATKGDKQATVAAFATLGKEGCGGCHQNYRKPQS